MDDRSALEISVLDVHECWRLLRTSDVGRLAVSADGGPEIFPLNYLVDHGTVVFRTGEGTKLTALAAAPSVSFEVDGSESGDTAAGDTEAWSVVLKGQAEQISGLDEGLDALTLPLFPWHGGAKHHFVRIVPTEITGRRFHVTGAEAWRNPLTGSRSVAAE